MKARRAIAGLAAVLSVSCAEPKPAPPPWPASPERDLLGRVIEAGVEPAAGSASLLDEALASRSPVVRSRAVLTLVRTRADDAPRRCRDLVANDRSPEVRLHAAWGLGEFGLEPRSATALRVAAALDAEPAVRAAAVRALGRQDCGDRAELACWLADPEPLVRQAAVSAASGAEDALALLGPRLEAESDERVRWRLCEALSRLAACRPDVVSRLESLTADPNFLVASFALRGLRPCAEASPAALLLGLEADRTFWLPRAIALRALLGRRAGGTLPPDVSLALEARIAAHAGGGLGALEYPLLRSLAAPALDSSGAAAAPAPDPAAVLAGPLFAALPARALGLLGLRHPRAVIRFAGKGAVTLELYAVDAPRHVNAFIALARAGCYDGRSLAAVDPEIGVSLTAPRASGGGAPAAPLPPETGPAPLLRGSLLAADAAGQPSAAPGALLIAHLPLPALDGRVTCWGAVLLGMEVVDRLEPGDRIERVEIAAP